jgi:hypothetical protein
MGLEPHVAVGFSCSRIRDPQIRIIMCPGRLSIRVIIPCNFLHLISILFRLNQTARFI